MMRRRGRSIRRSIALTSLLDLLFVLIFAFMLQSQDALDESRVDVTRQKVLVEAAQASAKQTQAALEQAKRRLGELRVGVPRSGLWQFYLTEAGAKRYQTKEYLRAAKRWGLPTGVTAGGEDVAIRLEQVASDDTVVRYSAHDVFASSWKRRGTAVFDRATAVLTVRFEEFVLEPTAKGKVTKGSNGELVYQEKGKLGKVLYRISGTVLGGYKMPVGVIGNDDKGRLLTGSREVHGIWRPDLSEVPQDQRSRLLERYVAETAEDWHKIRPEIVLSVRSWAHFRAHDYLLQPDLAYRIIEPVVEGEKEPGLWFVCAAAESKIALGSDASDLLERCWKGYSKADPNIVMIATLRVINTIRSRQDAKLGSHLADLRTVAENHSAASLSWTITGLDAALAKVAGAAALRDLLAASVAPPGERSLRLEKALAALR